MLREKKIRGNLIKNFSLLGYEVSLWFFSLLVCSSDLESYDGICKAKLMKLLIDYITVPLKFEDND